MELEARACPRCGTVAFRSPLRSSQPVPRCAGCGHVMAPERPTTVELVSVQRHVPGPEPA
jgi:uncharacterized Zn finger protein